MNHPLFDNKTSINAVIGSGYGDEGKGLVTDALSSPMTRVVRFNGGAQAAHTVVLPNGHRQVFHHVGSGALGGSPTHLSRFFVVNPILAVDEIEALSSRFEIPEITVDPRCPVTTPVDMMINQELEKQRGDDRHGSCGIGFGETIERQQSPYEIDANDIFNNQGLDQLVNDVVNEWLPVRCEALGIDPDNLPCYQSIIDKFIEDCETFRGLVTLRPDKKLAVNICAVVFEGAQGLGLDQDIGHFPHVTRSHTGLTNVIALARESGVGVMNVIYVSRTYATRHGNGPLSKEDAWKFTKGKLDLDPTNPANEWQGTMRYAPLDYDERNEWICQDQERNQNHNIDIRSGLFVTCTDQMSGLDPREIAERFGLPLWGTSHGPSRDDVKWHRQ